MAAVSVGAGAREGDESLATELLSGCGRVLPLPEEHMDAFTAVAGSGPAYLFYLAEAMQQGAEACGLEPEDADTIIRQTLLGAATLLSVDGRPAYDLRKAVTSRGGTTQAATEMLDVRAVMGAIRDAVVAARDRARELAEG
jgi:pyrroline-5-carboxylate reductase